MSCEHGLTIKECYVCMSPKYGEKKNNMSITAMKQALEALERLFGIPEQFTGKGGGDVAVWRLGGSYRAQQAIPVLRQAIEQAEKQEPIKIDGNTSDGYHTFNELYEFRKAYNVALFNEWASGGKCSVHKSWRHHDGELCFGGGWFIVVAVLPQGQISNHYEAKDWNLFAIPEVERALFEFDGHTGNDVIERLEAYTTPQPQREWVGLTDEEIKRAPHHMVDGAYHYSFKQGAEWAEAKLRSKNT